MIYRYRGASSASISLISFEWRDLFLALGLATMGAILALIVAHQIGSFFFYQAFTPESLMWACGRGFRHPLPPTPEMIAFLLRRDIAVFDCGTISTDIPSGPPGAFAYSQIYLSWAAAGLWRVFGVTQTSLTPLVALLNAAYAAGLFVLARAFLPRYLAVGAAAALVLSPVAVTQIFFLRDFSKGPFLIWALSLLFWVPRMAPSQSLGTAFLAGVVLGVGYGFRMDVVIMLPLGAVFLALASRQSLMFRVGLIGVYMAGFVPLAAPVLSPYTASSSGFLVMQGATEPFRNFLALDAAPYQLGHAYSDELTLSGIAAEERPRRPEWDEKEPAPVYGISQSIKLSSENLARWAPNFAADFFTQGLKGAAWVLGFPALVAVSRRVSDPGSPLRLNIPIAQWQEPIYASFGQPWMPVAGLVGLMALLLRVAARSRREALATAWLLSMLLTYPAVQFSIRHIFYLEFIWVIALLSILCAIAEWRRLAPALRCLLLSASLTTAAVTLVFFGFGRFQQRSLTSEFSDLLSLPQEVVKVSRMVELDGSTLWRTPVPPAHSAIVMAAPDSMTPHISEVGPENDVRTGGERMILLLGGASCPAAAFTLRLQYDHRSDFWQPLDSALTVRSGTTIIFPAFYRATQNFAGLSVPDSHSACEINLFRVPMTPGLPLVLTAVLPPNWRAIQLRKGFGRFN